MVLRLEWPWCCPQSLFSGEETELGSPRFMHPSLLLPGLCWSCWNCLGIEVVPVWLLLAGFLGPHLSLVLILKGLLPSSLDAGWACPQTDRSDCAILNQMCLKMALLPLALSLCIWRDWAQEDCVAFGSQGWLSPQRGRQSLGWHHVWILFTFTGSGLNPQLE